MKAPRNLEEWLQRLRERGDLATVEAPVDAELEVPEIHRRVIAAGGPALLFTNVVGSAFPLAVNLFGTRERVLSAFGSRPLELIEQIAALPHTALPPTPGRLFRQRGLFAALARTGLKRARRKWVEETPPRLTQLPATKSWARDGGRFFTLPLVYTEHPENGGSNLGIYRMQIFGDTDTGLHMQIGKGGGFHLAAAEAIDQPLPVAVNLGGPPAALLGALAPLPENVPEILLASLVLGQRLPLCKHRSSPLPFLADADFVLLGELRPGERRPEGPFGDHYGYYSETHDYPVLRCHTLLHRPKAVLPATVVGKPRQEDFFLGDFLQELLAPLFPLAMPGVRDLWSYGETGYHSLAGAVVHERYKREAMASAFRILGEGQLSLTKFLLCTDSPVDLRDFRSTLTHVLARADFRTDLFLLPNLSMDSLDYAGPRINEGGKGVLLGLGDPIRDLPTSFEGAPPSSVRKVCVFAPGCLVLEGPPASDAPNIGQELAAAEAFRDWPLLVLVDDAVRASKSSANFLWTTFTRFDPGADLLASSVELAGGHAVRHAPLLIDARMKPGYPEELFCDPDTAKRVEARWTEYFPGGGVEMGDSDRGHLD